MIEGTAVSTHPASGTTETTLVEGPMRRTPLALALRGRGVATAWRGYGPAYGRTRERSGKMAMAEDRGAASLAACVAHVLGVDTSEIPNDGGTGLGQWLAGRNLGLVPVGAPETFEWPGCFLGLRRGSSGWAVFFGAPPGVVFDPATGSDGGSDGGTEGILEAAFVLAEHELAEHDPPRGTGRDPGSPGTGTVETIAVAAEAGAPMTAALSAEALAGRGLAGDRYERGEGTFSNPDGRGYDLTLVEAEALEKLAAGGVELAPEEARRNLVVRDVALDGLIGKRFRVGEVECFGQRRCEPCAHLERLTRPGVLRGLLHRGGLRADVLSGGEIRIGDRIEASESPHYCHQTPRKGVAVPR